MGVNYNPGIVTDGLVLCVDAANSKSYAGSGTDVFDMSGGATGTLEGTGGFSSNNNGSFICNGTDSNINMGNILDLRTGDMTYSVWYKSSATSFAAASYLVTKTDSNASSYRQAFGFTTSMNFYVILRAASNASYDTASITNPKNDTEWHNAVWVIDRSGFYYVYQDCALLHSKDISAIDGQDFIKNRPLRIGSYNTSTDTSIGWFSGNISAVTIYNRVLDANEIKQNFNALRGRYGI